MIQIRYPGVGPLGVVEWDKGAWETIRENQKRGCPLVKNWPLIEGDVRKFDLASIRAGVDLGAGGPPRHPPLRGGNAKRGHRRPRYF